MRTLILDNYDSFTYNLYQYVAALGGNPVVYRNDEITIAEIKKLKPTHIIISPGPGNPTVKKDFGVCAAVIKSFGMSGNGMKPVPILGVCLGHQGIIAEFGGKIIRAPEIMHGKTSDISLLGSPVSPLFKGIPKTFEAMRYHSLIGEKSSIPKCLRVTAETAKNKLVMAVEHKDFPIYGIQFHPESIGTKVGMKILKNFLMSS